MYWFQIAHLNIQGNDIIIVPFTKGFGQKTKPERDKTINEFQTAAKKVGLKGTIVPVWPHGQSVQFVAPRPWHAFFKQIDWPWIESNLNKEMLV
ncbi:MAG: hypothetical protein AAF830_12325 [Pseudomonadota bacterium]